jgi:GAF domain-containing protein
MGSNDYLTAFVEVDRAVCEGADNATVLHAVVRRLTATLGLKGCFIRMKAPRGDRIEMVASFGLSDHFLFSEAINAQDSICFCLPVGVVCFSQGQNANMADVTEAMMLERIHSAAVVPIEVEQEIVAMVALFSGAPREFSKADLNFAEALAGQGVLSVLWKRRVEEGIDRERHYLKSFQEISSAINSTLNIGQVLDMVVTKVTEILGGIGTTLRLLDPKTQNLYLAQSYGLSKEFLSKGPVDPQQSIAENMAGRIAVIDDVFADPRLQYPGETAEEGIRKLLSIPLTVRGKVIGVLRVFTAERPSFTKREIHFATAIAQQCALAIENARLYQRLKYEYQQLLIEFGYDGSSRQP